MRRDTHNEHAFTLIELLVVVVIIGLLAAISLPIYLNQQKAALAATLKSDLHTAAITMQTEAVNNNGKYTSWVPAYDPQSPNNQISVDQTRSNSDYYCLLGTNSNLPGITYAYSSANGLSTSGSCPDLTTMNASATSFTQQRSSNLSGQKALIVYHSSPFMQSSIQSYGYTTVDTVTESAFASMSDSAIAAYKLVFIEAYVWAAPSNVEAKAATYYANGGKLLQDGNDSTSASNPFIASASAHTNSSATYTPTHAQGLSPSFPYTFPATAFGTDTNWMCTTAVTGGAVVVATSADAGATCDTMFAASNGSGRWVFMSTINSLDAPTQAALDWLNA